MKDKTDKRFTSHGVVDQCTLAENGHKVVIKRQVMFTGGFPNMIQNVWRAATWHRKLLYVRWMVVGKGEKKYLRQETDVGGKWLEARIVRDLPCDKDGKPRDASDQWVNARTGGAWFMRASDEIKLKFATAPGSGFTKKLRLDGWKCTRTSIWYIKYWVLEKTLTELQMNERQYIERIREWMIKALNQGDQKGVLLDYIDEQF